MKYKDALRLINSRLKFGIKPGLERIRSLLDKLGNPQDNFKSVHVSGTNGKGSICAMLSSILINCNDNLKVGAFSSPHLIDERERIKINNKKISKKFFIKYTKKFLKITNKNKIFVTEFEFITAMAFQFFSDKRIDIAILETGLGGRLDSTNVVSKTVLCVISEISFDHTKILGKTLLEIAREKAGIIKNNAFVVVSPNQKPEILKIFEKKCKKLNCNFVFLENKIEINQNTCVFDKYEIFNYEDKCYKIPLLGEYQSLNLATVLSCVDFLKKHFKISDSSVEIGLKKVRLRARFEKISVRPLIIIDGAHNLSAVKYLRLSVEKYLKNFKKIALFAAMKDKDIEKMLKEVDNLFEEIIITRVKNSRAANIEYIYKIAKNFFKKVTCCENAEEAIRIVIQKNKQACIIFGSLYLAGEVLNIFNQGLR
ncbi:MAG: bifunctional folylpolyglutamate synthase/dihydrofolate synthase [Candidatus Improbicoccus pseudotrichonymphae]|uniref:tetrahydrofolate synthase n=1 Tax=Candidatus Improbicoccus pseudotrichonymphae TaxID=3033792 RepID=A0AA48KVC5_9FIRM|nr:MAG: bifunctional folylpolyglutamate synthase/dihydrofolate synthase [Candidatus Improbicoccus pseudotrichonymphae]